MTKQQTLEQTKTVQPFFYQFKEKELALSSLIQYLQRLCKLGGPIELEYQQQQKGLTYLCEFNYT